MVILFSSATIVQSPSFAAGILPAPAAKPSRTERLALDRAWHCGWTAAAEGGPCVQPPASFSDAEAGAFYAAVDSYFAGAWDDADLKAEQAEFEDMVACGFYPA